jgi:hypothetical protein
MVCIMLVVCTMLGTGCRKRQCVREHRFFHRNAVPYQNITAGSCSCASPVPATIVMPPTATAIEMIPAPKAMPKTNY